MTRIFTLILIASVFTKISIDNHAQAACPTPDGMAVEGEIVYNKDWKTMQFCNGSKWVAMNGGGGGGGAAPSGAIMAFDLEECPIGWSEYAPSSGNFLRGRCIDGESCADPSGQRMVGSLQADALGSHTHTGVTASAGAHSHTFPVKSDHRGGSASSVAAGSATNRGNLTTSSSGAHTHTLSINPTGEAETRPVNVAVLYCRKD